MDSPYLAVPSNRSTKSVRRKVVAKPLSESQRGVIEDDEVETFDLSMDDSTIRDADTADTDTWQQEQEGEEEEEEEQYEQGGIDSLLEHPNTVDASDPDTDRALAEVEAMATAEDESSGLPADLSDYDENYT